MKGGKIMWKRKEYEDNKVIKCLLMIRMMILYVLIALFITNCVFHPFVISGTSMETTLEGGEYVLSNVFTPIFFGINRFDVVAVKSPENDGELWVKRVIGMPGDTISYEKNVLTINGEIHEESYVKTDDTTYQYNLDFKDKVLGENEYFLMGDNRDVSKDSRRVGPFQREAIIAKDIIVLFPFTKIKVIK